LVSVGHSLSLRTPDVFPKAKRPPKKKEKLTINIAEAKATGAPIRSGPPKKAKAKRDPRY